VGLALELVLKVTEVCNINCSYCYFFNGPDKSFQAHPKLMSLRTAGGVADYIRRAAGETQLDAVRLVLHGGEPLMLGKRRFTELCERLHIGDCAARTGLSVQTNAMLVDDEWIEIFARFGIDVGVSVDGPADYHDAFRVDHRGRGTHARTAAGVRRLREARDAGRLKSLGAICVVDPTRDARRVYRHIVDELGFRTVAFNFPDADWGNTAPETVARMGDFLGAALEEWLSDDDPSIAVRPFTGMLAFARAPGLAAWRALGETLVLGVASDGSLAPDDSYRMTMPDVFRPDAAALTVWNSELGDFRTRYGDGPLPGLSASKPGVCTACAWSAHCRSGEGAHRYDPAGHAWRETVYCEALKRVYARLRAYVVENGGAEPAAMAACA